MLQTLHNLKRVDSYNQEAFSIEYAVVRFGNRVKNLSKGVDKNKGEEILKIVSKILDFCLNEPNQNFSRLPISLAQLKAGNNSKKI